MIERQGNYVMIRVISWDLEEVEKILQEEFLQVIEESPYEHCLVRQIPEIDEEYQFEYQKTRYYGSARVMYFKESLDISKITYG